MSELLTSHGYSYNLLQVLESDVNCHVSCVVLLGLCVTVLSSYLVYVCNVTMPHYEPSGSRVRLKEFTLCK